MISSELTFAFSFLAFATRTHLQGFLAAAGFISLCSLSVADLIQSSPSNVNGPTRVCGTAPGHVHSCLLPCCKTACTFPVVRSYGYQPTTSGQSQLIAQEQSTAASARTGKYRVINTIRRTATRRTLSITPRDNGKRTLRPLSTSRNSKSGTASNRSLDQGHARPKICMVTMRQWPAAATRRNTSLFLRTLPSSSTSTISFALYTNIELDSAVRAPNGLYSFHDIGVATYNRLRFHG